MGKPSLSKILQSSNHSLLKSSSSLQRAMGSRKKNKRSRNARKKRRNLANKLLESLKNKTEIPAEDLSESSSNVTVIEINDTKEETVVGKKRKLEETNECAKVPKLEESCIIICDEDYRTPQKVSRINCSTPNSTAKPLIECNISSVCDETKEINSKSYLTIDLTTETLNSSAQNTVIDLENISAENVSEVIDVDNTVIERKQNKAKVVEDCSLVSVSEGSILSDSDVTVIRQRANSKINKFAKGIANLNTEEKGKLLELITANIFNGCNVTSSSTSLPKQSRATETAEDAYIKEVILGKSQSRNSIGSNIYNPEKDLKSKTKLRMVVIDGSNVAMEHGKGKYFSVKGLKICIEYFVKRGHIVKAFVPRFRCKFGKSTEPRLLSSLERQGLVVFTPSREVQGKNIVSYDDRYIIQCAAEFDGVIVSGDNYRDLLKENSRWRFVIENRLIPFTWVEDMIMFPKDPLGRNGPSLGMILKRND